MRPSELRVRNQELVDSYQRVFALREALAAPSRWRRSDRWPRASRIRSVRR